MILGIDAENRRIALGHKQVLDNPWDTLGEAFSEGTDTTGKIVRIIEKGVIVELPGGIDGFVPASQLAFHQIRSVGDVFKIDETLNLRVIEFDSENKKIVLSATEWLKGQDKAIVEEYNAKHPIPKETVEESHKRAPRRSSKKALPSAEAPVENAPVIGSYELPEEMIVPEKGTEIPPMPEPDIADLPPEE